LLGWSRLPGRQPRELRGSVVESHNASEDATPNHINADFNWFVYPDPADRHLLLRPGIWKTADPYEHGRIEVEWERRSNDWPGLPEWAWPAQGDRTYQVGWHVFDCGHEEEGHRSEIHPPWFLATYRNAALNRLAGSSPLGQVEGRTGSVAPDGTAATQVDAYASTFGGHAIRSAGPIGSGWYQPVDDLDYQFVVRAPPTPSASAELRSWVEMHGALNAGGIEPLLTPLPDGRSYLVTMPMTHARSRHEEKQAFGMKVWAGWQGAGVPKANTRRYRVTFKELDVKKQGRGSVLTGEDGPNNEQFAKVTAGDKIQLKTLNHFDVTLMPGQPLRVAARVSSWVPRLARLGVLTGESAFMGTAEKIWQSPPADALIEAGSRIAVGSENDTDKQCRSACFSVKVTVTPLP
jgi:hypothetical protein